MSDLNLYYDVHHPLWHKRPDWFLAVGVPRLYDGHDLRRSYVVLQEGSSPAVVVEFLSPRTEQEDLGRFYREGDRVEPEDENLEPIDLNQVLGKLDVYETYLRVPHYLVYSRYTQQLRYFKLIGRQYEEQPINPSPLSIWLSDLNIGLGVWEGEFEGIPGHWLRWCDAQENWLLTDTEQEYQAKQQAQRQTQDAQQRVERLAQRLRELGVDPDHNSAFVRKQLP
nr:Uma2 family endonuclease [Nodosilinea sp. TSF1-S3]